ncbi:flagellar basal body rod protein FlgB [Desulfotruncus alcoholivorax]|uniref:flagellar basal body rod protein FlgB n=1 Tax=Desulfotruncus alcoholivorax TaxID=265477 RepID=UPI00042583CE|nr:flagellar basal body rod protein FlgB [Desulfotruncus alcoholivorax]
MKLFNDGLSSLLVKQMDACTLRQRVIANNIANINTPGFKKSEVNFQQQLMAALNNSEVGLRVTNQRHIGAANNLQQLEPEVVQVEDTSMSAAKNNVDIDEEMVNLAANTLVYRLATRINSDRVNLMSYVIKGGR